MSNIQITENGSGKYSPEWFYSESQTPEWISFAHKADELRENFINLFIPRSIKIKASAESADGVPPPKYKVSAVSPLYFSASRTTFFTYAPSNFSAPDSE